MQTIVVFSGGMDSTTLLYRELSLGHKVKALSVNYGQRHVIELKSAQSICKLLGVEWRLADLSNLRPLLAGSSLTSSDIAVPEGHYAAPSMKQTVVPNRNMLLLSVAVAWAISSKFTAVAYAAHAGDHTIYPDCRPEFTEALEQAIRLADWHKVRLVRPFVHMTKGHIVTLGTKLGVPFEKTWSCYKGGKVHCGVCGTCVERKLAFEEADVSDPTKYLA